MDHQNRARVLAAIERFAETGEGDVKKLTSVKPPQWRQRVGVWRVRFRKHVKDELLEILHVRHRSEAYDG